MSWDSADWLLAAMVAFGVMVLGFIIFAVAFTQTHPAHFYIAPCSDKVCVYRYNPLASDVRYSLPITQEEAQQFINHIEPSILEK